MTRTSSESPCKGLTRRPLVVILSLVLVAALFVCAHAQASYSRLAAFQYAQKYWNKVCSDGYFFADSETPSMLGAGQPVPTNEEGFDCAHFPQGRTGIRATPPTAPGVAGW